MSKESEGKRGVDLIFDALPFGQLCYGDPNAVSNAIRIRHASQPFTSRRDSGLR
jgi:hypothetical protein